MNKVAQKSSKAILVVKALLAAYVVSAVLLLLLALILYKVDPPSGVISVGVILTYIISTFITGYIVGKRTTEKRYLWGIGMGAIYFLIIFVVSLIWGKDVFGDFGSTISVLLMCGLGGMLGGMLS